MFTLFMLLCYILGFILHIFPKKLTGNLEADTASLCLIAYNNGPCLLLPSCSCANVVMYFYIDFWLECMS